MVAVRIYLEGNDRVGPIFKRNMERQSAAVLASARGAAQDAADEIEEKGAEDIASAGNFGSRWTQGLHARVTEGGGNIRVSVTHDVKYFGVFETGKVIQGNPLLWIPFKDTDAVGVLARDYSGALFHVVSKSGLELLGSTEAAKAGDERPMRYFGKDEVVIPRKFHISEIAREAARKLKSFYSARKKTK